MSNRLLYALPLAVLALACQKKEPAGAAGEGAPSGTAAPAAEGAEIVIGHVGSLTGQEATFGVSTDQGVRLAVEELNAKGGIKGKKLRVQTVDDQGKPTEAAAATTKLILQDRATVIIGEVASSRSLAMAPIAQTNQVPMISPSSTNPKVTEGKDFVFRVCFIDPFQGAVMARFAKNDLKLGKVAILRDVRNDYSVGLADVFTGEFTKLGGTIVTDQSYSAGDIDFKSQLTAIRAAAPQALWVPGYYTDVGLIARQARELGITVPLLGGDGWESAKLFEIGGSALEGSYYSNHYAVEDPSPAIARFVTTYKAKYGEIPDSLAALGYDAVMVAAAAMEKSPTLAGPALRDHIAQTKDFPGVTGSITLDGQRNAVKPAVVLKVTGKSAVYQTTVNPS
jgi:branched-chain amino acid transport system substrate-binding protein